METLNWNRLNDPERVKALGRAPSVSSAELHTKVAALLNEVRREGDIAVRRLTRELDGVDLESSLVTPEEMEEAQAAVTQPVRAALERAVRQIGIFHRAQVPQPVMVEVAPGIVCERQFRPIQKVGLYVPGGTAPLPSTVLMLGVPAWIAKCEEVTLCTPPQRDGRVNPHILVAAKLCGISRIYKIGGAQAIAAMAYGTASLPKVDKIFGPGNSWVTEAKRQVAQDASGAAIDMPAGPSEVMVIADAKANPEFVAWDLLSQAEHGTDSQVMLVTDSESMIGRVLAEVEKAMVDLPRRQIAEGSLKHSRVILVESLAQAIEVSNAYAPEHLILQVEDAGRCVDHIRHAGSVFLGAWAPESVGDYASGTNHVLPTYGYARATSGLSMDSFFKSITFQCLNETGLKDIGPTVETLAEVEGLHAHRNAVSVRLKELRK